jgi:hypothetical protein
MRVTHHGAPQLVNQKQQKHIKIAGSLLALLWVLLDTLGVSVRVYTKSASMAHMCELGLKTQKVTLGAACAQQHLCSRFFCFRFRPVLGPTLDQK